MQEVEIDFEEIELKTPEDFDKLVEKTRYQTVPQIFINGEFIGGCDELYSLHALNKLNKN